jgi:uncharacterized membrane protein YqgA involved in biofilm formation
MDFGLFVLAIGFALTLRLLLDPTIPTGADLAVLGGLLAGGFIGELLRLSDRLDDVGDWFQRRLAGGAQPSRISEGFVTASLVFCVGPLTILRSIENGLTGDIQLLAIKSLLDGIAAIAFAAALGAGVYLSAITVFVIQAVSPPRRGCSEAGLTRLRSTWRAPPAACSCWEWACACWRSGRFASSTSCRRWSSPRSSS